MTAELTFRFGSSKQNPTAADLERALGELFEERRLGLPEGDLEEHPNAWLSWGYESGSKWTVVTVDIYRTGLVIFTKLDDQDDDRPSIEHQLRHVSRDTCLRLWQDLAAGDEEKVLQVLRGRGPTSG